MTQTEWILSRLQRGPLTALDALNGCGRLRLAARIGDLRRAGYNIVTTTIETTGGKHVAQYSLTKGKE
ncbi:MAG: hypothetical protein DDT26_00189 [Dehalococcoidia bacterium]|nr:hypothetical protein [Chloroflexota bacterium]